MDRTVSGDTQASLAHGPNCMACAFGKNMMRQESTPLKCDGVQSSHLIFQIVIDMLQVQESDWQYRILELFGDTDQGSQLD